MSTWWTTFSRFFRGWHESLIQTKNRKAFNSDIGISKQSGSANASELEFMTQDDVQERKYKCYEYVYCQGHDFIVTISSMQHKIALGLLLPGTPAAIAEVKTMLSTLLPIPGGGTVSAWPFNFALGCVYFGCLGISSLYFDEG
jgi:hypothetical protein